MEISNQMKYVKPYPQQILNGALGVTSEDIATTLGVRHDNIRKALSETNFIKHAESIGLNFTTIVVKIEKTRGRPRKVHVFDTESAKLFVARYGSLEGFRYCHFLVQCERVVFEMIPRLREEVSKLEEALSKKTDKQLNAPRKGMIAAPVYHQGSTLFPTEVTPILAWKLLPKDSLSEADLLRARIRVLTKSIEGMGKTLSKDNETLEEVRTKKDIKLTELFEDGIKEIRN